MYVNRNVIKFCSKLREFDRNYEKNNNGELDNGVYIECEYSNYSINLPEYHKEDEEKEDKPIIIPERASSLLSVFIDDPLRKMTINDLGFYKKIEKQSLSLSLLDLIVNT